MIIARKQALDAIIQALGFIESSVSYSSGLNLYDVNVIAEQFFELFLSAAYKKQLANLNTGTTQQPAIDLGDASSGICFQVTSNGRKGKIKETVDRYLNHQLFKKFPHLRVLIVGRRRGKYSGIAVPAAVTFNVDVDIIGFRELVKHVQSLGTPDLQRLEAIIHQELPIFSQVAGIKHQSDLTALKTYRSYFDRPALHDPWAAEWDYAAFGGALTELICLINKGWADGVLVAKRRTEFTNPKWSQSLAIIASQLLVLRQLFSVHVKSGEIDLGSNLCNFKDQRVPQAIDDYKKAVLSQVNSLLGDAGIPGVP